MLEMEENESVMNGNPFYFEWAAMKINWKYDKIYKNFQGID